MRIVYAILLIGVVTSLAEGQATQPVKPTSAESTVSRMLKSAGPAVKPLPPVGELPAIDATSGKGSVAPSAPQQTVLREGTFLVDRTGRLQRSADGQQMEFHFEADGKALRDPPVVIIPNLTLMKMENAVSSSSRDLRFRITGMVTEYRGRNYVLLEKCVVVSDVVQPF